MNPGDTIQGAYILTERLGSSPFAETWAATASEGCIATPAGTKLVLKLLSLGEMPDWKGFDYFEREAAALKAIRHPAVPRYVDSFHLEEGSKHLLGLAMERVPGRSLAAEAADGKRWTESEIERMFAELLDILGYLHSVRPPIIHRDVNPKNIIVRPDGTLALVDFSGVQDAVRLAYRDTATMTGTAGYAPIEQVSGRASVRSDLYAAAATASFLLTGRHPSDLPMRGLRPDPSALVELSGRLAYVIDAYLEPDEALRDLAPEDAAKILRKDMPVPAKPMGSGTSDASKPQNAARSNSLTQALSRLTDLATDRLQALDRREDEDTLRAPVSTLPSDSTVVMERDRGCIRILVPRIGLSQPSFWGGGLFAVFWLGFVAFWTSTAILAGAPIFFPLFSLPFWAVGIFLVRSLIKPLLTRVELTVTPETGLVFEERFLGRTRTRSWPFSDVGACSIKDSALSQRGRIERELALEAGTATIRFGKSLSDRERRAISSTLNDWLDQNRPA